MSNWPLSASAEYLQCIMWHTGESVRWPGVQTHLFAIVTVCDFVISHFYFELSFLICLVLLPTSWLCAFLTTVIVCLTLVHFICSLLTFTSLCLSSCLLQARMQTLPPKANILLTCHSHRNLIEQKVIIHKCSFCITISSLQINSSWCTHKAYTQTCLTRFFIGAPGSTTVQILDGFGKPFTLITAGQSFNITPADCHRVFVMI